MSAVLLILIASLTLLAALGAWGLLARHERINERQRAMLRAEERLAQAWAVIARAQQRRTKRRALPFVCGTQRLRSLCRPTMKLRRFSTDR
jgi:hypothetical protein